MKNQKGFVWLPALLVILGIVVAGGGAYYIMQQNATPQTPIYQDQTNTQPVTQETSQTAPKPQTSVLANQPATSNAVDPELSAGPTSGAAPLGVSFSANKQGLIDHKTDYSVDFGDGTKSSTSQFTCGLQYCSQQHAYQVGGTYTAKYIDSSGKTVKSFSIAVSAGATVTGTVVFPNGVSFTLPSGWSAGPVKTGTGYYPGDTNPSYSILLYSSSKTIVGGVDCPPVPKGGEGEGVATSTKRSVQKSGNTWTATYGETGGGDVSGPIVVDGFKSDFYTQSIGTECLLTLGTSGVSVSEARIGAQTIYNSWQ